MPARLRGGFRLEVLAVAVALVPIATAVARALRSEWIPIGDNALVEIRSRDVFSLAHLPLLGTWSSASLSAGTDLNHPGPLLFDLLAPFVALFGGPAGVAIGIGVLNAAAVVGCAIVGYRVLGRLGALCATLTAAALSWTLGSVMLTDPWNPHPLVLPCLLMLLLTWGVAQGDRTALAWLVAVASLCLQVHLGYAYLVPALCLVAVMGLATVHLRRWRIDPSTKQVERRELARSAVWALVVAMILWTQPIVEQLFGAGRGNVSRILGSTGGTESTLGPSLAMRIVAGVVVLPPWWGRSSFTETVTYTKYGPDGRTLLPVDLVSTIPSMLALLGLGVLLALLAGAAWRGRHRQVLAAVLVAGAGVAVALVSLSISPIGPLGLTPHQMRWVWSIGAFTSCALIVGVVVVWGERSWVSRVLFGAIVVVGVANVPYHLQAAGPAQFVDQLPTARELSRQMAAYSPSGSVRVIASDLRFTESYSTVVMSALQRDGIDVRVVEEGLVRQLGPARRADGTEVAELRLAEGRAALDDRPGAERIALAGPLTMEEIDELLALEARLIEGLRRGDVTLALTPYGMQQVGSGGFRLDPADVAGLLEAPVDLLRQDVAAEMLLLGLLTVESGDPIEVARFVGLRSRVGVTTVAVYAVPLTVTNG